MGRGHLQSQQWVLFTRSRIIERPLQGAKWEESKDEEKKILLTVVSPSSAEAHYHPSNPPDIVTAEIFDLLKKKNRRCGERVEMFPVGRPEPD